MATPKKRKRRSRKKQKVQIKLTERARLVHKNDKTRVQPVDTLRKIKGRPPADVAPTFRIKIKKK